MLAEPVMLFEHIPTPFGIIPAAGSPITSVSLMYAGRLLPTVHANDAATKRTACRVERSLARLMLAYLGFREHAG